MAKPPAAVLSLRNPAAPLYSAATLNPERLNGSFALVESLGSDPGCTPGGAEISGPVGAQLVTWSLCLPAGVSNGHAALVPAGPGRFEVKGLGQVWVLWVDADYRTLVLGTPSGAFGLVLDRSGTLPADRARAAHEILDWNGYATRRPQT